MDRSPLVVPVSELRDDAAQILRRASSCAAPVYVTQRGRLAAVLLSRPVYERLRHAHEVLCRVVSGELDVGFQPGMPLEQVLSRGEQALDKQRRTETRELAREARRLDEREREPPQARPPLTLKQFFQAEGYTPSWPGAQEWYDSET